MVILQPYTDYDKIVDSLIENNYPEEFCIALSFEPAFIRTLMKAGFLVMSYQDKEALLLPKLHRERSVLFFKDLHIPRSVRPFLSRYTLKPFDALHPIMEACIAVHGEDWLTKPLRDALSGLEWSQEQSAPSAPVQNRQVQLNSPELSEHDGHTFCSAFGLYRDSELVAGEFGVFCGAVYTSYSGFYREKSTGTTQMILTARFLEERGFAFWDLGMPLEYKNRLGAVALERTEFIQKFRGARLVHPKL